MNEHRSLVDKVADRVAERLSESVIPSSFPAAVGDWIREACKHGAVLWIHTLPMNGPTAITTEYRMNPDGTLNLEFRDTRGCTFWRGTFRPAG